MANRNPRLEQLFSEEGVLCQTPEDMVALGREVSVLLRRGTVVSLEGPLGAGKTQLSKGMAAALGCSDEASSPSFTLVHEYGGGRLPLHHFDFYRLKSSQELLAIGYDDSLGNGAVMIEWGDKFPEALPAGTVRVRITILPEGGRRVRASHQP
jgi:tRNA threonylcarbamoyladenosine biosynthesis protein TsaE